VRRRISESVQHESYSGSGEDAHGNEVEIWTPAVELGIYAFDPGSSSEPLLPGQDRVITAPTILFPSASEVRPRDRVTVRGKLFEADGESLDFRNPFNPSMDGKTIKLKAVDG
jgi:hypothetical protein